MAGLFVTFEGIDGSGKSTQMKRVAEALEANGQAVTLTRNPGGTELGQQIRGILLHHKGFVSPTCELLLYMADRAQHREEIIEPALTAGNIVLCDRYGDSSIAYQGYGRGLSQSMIEDLNVVATQGKAPDLTVLLSGPVETLLRRTEKRGELDRLEQETTDFFERVHLGYISLAQKYPQRFLVLDALKEPEFLTSQILEAISAALNLKIPAA